MSTCDGCGNMILFGGEKVGALRFCNLKCISNSPELIAIYKRAQQIPDAVVQERLNQTFEGDCPQCGSRGGIDFHESHTILSILLASHWESTSALCCHSCGTKSRIYATLTSSLFGWWCFPWGIMVTPIQIGRNVIGLIKFASTEPSPRLIQHIRMSLAAENLPEETIQEQA